MSDSRLVAREAQTVLFPIVGCRGRCGGPQRSKSGVYRKQMATEAIPSAQRLPGRSQRGSRLPHAGEASHLDHQEGGVRNAPPQSHATRAHGATTPLSGRGTLAPAAVSQLWQTAGGQARGPSSHSLTGGSAIPAPFTGAQEVMRDHSFDRSVLYCTCVYPLSRLPRRPT